MYHVHCLAIACRHTLAGFFYFKKVFFSLHLVVLQSEANLSVAITCNLAYIYDSRFTILLSARKLVGVFFKNVKLFFRLKINNTSGNNQKCLVYSESHV